ncbi:PopZ family protein [Rhizobium sp.]|uniref:PopZ family protein n=1 Tax=Rhizobium sp. TaxID=391 RepID=UPI002F22FDB6
MAQPSVVREPSMEEILASIRRIIESNEPGAAHSISPSLPAVYTTADDERDDDIHLTVDEEFAAADLANASQLTTADSEPRFVAANSQVPMREPEAPGRTLSLADVAARVRAASERNAAQLNPTREAPQLRELPPAMVARLAEARVEPLAGVPLRNTVNEAPVSAVTAPTAALLAEAALHAAKVEAQAGQKQAEERPAAAAAPVEGPVSNPSPQQPAAATADRFLPQVQAELSSSLMSEAAGAQVARSFGELAAAIDGSERRSLDEIAEEMLRPMLQDWLDDNLPTLVERLVREEIERVARGPRR